MIALSLRAYSTTDSVAACCELVCARANNGFTLIAKAKKVRRGTTFLAEYRERNRSSKLNLFESGFLIWLNNEHSLILRYGFAVRIVPHVDKITGAQNLYDVFNWWFIFLITHSKPHIDLELLQLASLLDLTIPSM